MRSCKFLRRTIFLLLYFALSFSPARAQAPLEPAQLPEGTSFYLIWRGAPSPAVRAANSLFALWDDPDLASARGALAENLVSTSEKKDPSAPKLTRADFDNFSSLLENPFVVGYISRPDNHVTADATLAPASAGTNPQSWSGLFFVYDRSGKELLLAKMILGLRSQEKDPPKVTHVTIGGVQAVKLESKSGVNYWAESGKYAFSANNPAVFEEIAARLAGKFSPRDSLALSAAYREAQPVLGGGLLEFFLRVPRPKDLVSAAAANPSGFRLEPLLDAIKLDSVHSLSGQVTLEGAKTHVRAAILGDAVTGTLFDIWAEGHTFPPSFALLPPGAISYTYTELDLPAIYALFKRAVRSALPPSRQDIGVTFDTLAQAKLGISLTLALDSLTGEFGSIQTSPVMDSANQVFFVGIRRKPEVLKIIRVLYGEMIQSERSEGDTTFLNIALHGKSLAAGTMSAGVYYLALTPDVLLGSSRAATLHDLLAPRHQPSGASASAFAASCPANRSQLPAKLNGLNCFDFQKLDWQALQERLIREAAVSAAAGAANGSQKSSANPAAWLSLINPQVFPRHLHSSSSATWKDAHGIHFEQWIE